MQNYILEIKSLILSAKDDYSSQDFIDGSNKIIQLIQKEIDECQDDINEEVEDLIDSFGGKSCTMRNLKGE